jgi:hypothetical protein
MAKPKLGSGGRFKALTDKGMSPALAAYVGRKKLGNKKFNELAAAARRQHNNHHKG